MTNPYVLVAGLLFVIATYFGGHHEGAKAERATWQAKEIATEAANQNAWIAASDSVEATELANQAKARKATADHEQAITDLHAHYAAVIAANKSAGGLRISRTVCPPATARDAATSPGGPDGASAATVELPAGVTDHLYALAQRADALAEQLRELQKYIQSVGLYGNAS